MPEGGRASTLTLTLTRTLTLTLTKVYRNRTRLGSALGIKRRRGREPRFEIARLLPRAVGAVLHVSDVNPSDYKIDEHGVVRNAAADGAAYTMVHQWNRAPYPVQNGIRRAWSSDRVSVPL